MIPDSRKLKRGLKDISPLFSAPQEAEPFSVLGEPPVPGIQCFSLFSQESLRHSRYLSRHLAAQLGTEACPCVAVYIDSSRPGPVREGEQPFWAFSSASSAGYFQEYDLTWEQFQAAFHQRNAFISRAGSSFQNLIVFLDFSYTNLKHVGKILPLLDKWILLMEPSLSSMSETYRIIKTSLLLNRSVEYFVLIQSPASNGSEGVLFEHFSEFMTRRLGVHLNWLGHFQPLDNLQPVLHETALGQLLLKPFESSSTLKEKKELAELIYTFSREK